MKRNRIIMVYSHDHENKYSPVVAVRPLSMARHYCSVAVGGTVANTAAVEAVLLLRE